MPLFPVDRPDLASFRASCQPLYPGIPFIAGHILPEAALAAAHAAQIRDDFDMVDIFGVLVAQMPLDPQPQRGTVTHTQWLVVEREGQDGLGMQRVDHVDALIISIAGNAYYESIDMVDALHPQTILAFALNDKPLSVRNGAPLRLRVERHLGYKHAKYIHHVEVVADLRGVRGGKGGFWEDVAGYEWYAGI